MWLVWIFLKRTDTLGFAAINTAQGMRTWFLPWIAAWIHCMVLPRFAQTCCFECRFGCFFKDGDYVHFLGFQKD